MSLMLTVIIIIIIKTPLRLFKSDSFSPAHFWHIEVIPSRSPSLAAFPCQSQSINQSEEMLAPNNKECEALPSVTHHALTKMEQKRFGHRHRAQTPPFLLLTPAFRMAQDYSERSISIYQDFTQRGNENSLVGFIRGETNFRFNKKKKKKRWARVKACISPFNSSSVFVSSSVHAFVRLFMHSNAIED